MGLDIYLKRKVIDKYNQDREKLEMIYKELNNTSLIFIDSYTPKNIPKEIKYISIEDLREFFKMLALIIEPPEDENEDLDKLFALLDIYQMYGLFDNATDEDTEKYNFLTDFYESLHEYNKDKETEKSEIECKDTYNKEIFYARKNKEVLAFYTKLAKEKNIITDSLYSFTEIPFTKEEFIKFMDEFDLHSSLDEYIEDFEDDNILFYGFIWS